MVTATGQRPGALSPAATAGGLTLATAGLGALVAWRPALALVAVVALLVLAAMMLRLEWAVLAYVAAEPFGDYLTALSSPAMKLIGAVLFTAWLLRLAMADRRPSLRHPALYAAGALALVLLASTVVNGGSAGAEVITRYLSYLGVLVVLADTMRNGLAPRLVAAVFVISCTAAAVVGFTVFLGSGGGRAAGPMGDANDLAFYLLCALPFALALWLRPSRDGGSSWRHLYAVAALMLLVAMLATFSRGALLGLAGVLALAALTGLLRLRAIAGGLAAVSAVVLLVVALTPALVQRSVEEKQYVADANVASRFTTWVMAAEMTADRPLLGRGPGGFRESASRYVADDVADTSHVEVPHQMYLDISSELGLLGLGAFLTMIGAAAAGAWRRARSAVDPVLGAAVCASLAGVLIAATFLSEQYYLPIWLLVALGVALDVPRGADEHRRPVTAPARQVSG